MISKQTTVPSQHGLHSRPYGATPLGKW